MVPDCRVTFKINLVGAKKWQWKLNDSNAVNIVSEIKMEIQ